MNTPFVEVVLPNPEGDVRLYYNPVDLKITTKGAIHLVELHSNFILHPKGGAALCKFLSTYEVSMTLRRDFKRWAAKGKYPFLCAVFYAIENPQMTRYRVLSAHSPDMQAYLQTQGHLMAAYVMSGFEGQLPRKGFAT